MNPVTTACSTRLALLFITGLVSTPGLASAQDIAFEARVISMTTGLSPSPSSSITGATTYVRRRTAVRLRSAAGSVGSRSQW